MTEGISRPAQEVLSRLTSVGQTLSVAESLTGGILSAKVVSVPGASASYLGGATVYATDAKAQVLGVEQALLEKVGPVDGDVAIQMARGVASLFHSDWGLSTTGVAGPGDTEDGVQGTVYVGVFGPCVQEALYFHFEGGREEVRGHAVDHALQALLSCLKRS